MLYYKDLYKIVYGMHEQLVGIKEMVIISGYVGYQTIKQLENLPSDIHSSIVYGMYGSEQISMPLHTALLEIQNTSPNIDIFYSTIPVHSKIYLWQSKKSLKRALVGSANFSVSGLKNNYKEVLTDVDKKSFSDLVNYCNRILDNSILCDDRGVQVKPVKKSYKISEKNKDAQPYLNEGICRVSLLDANNEVPAKSGLNWGCSDAHVKLGDAYIRITMDYIRDFPNLFPAKKYVGIENVESSGRKSRENDEVELIWDDGVRMIGLLEGQQSSRIDGLVYPKQLSSSPSKSIMGIYLRNRLGVPLNHVITTRDLLKYGRTYIDISLIGEGLYYLDFSTKK